MSVAPAVQRTRVYPIKVLDPVVVPAARILAGGALEHDREFALLDKDGNLINGKREPRIHSIRAIYNLGGSLVTLRAPGSTSRTFHLVDNLSDLEEWFGNYLACRVSLQRNTTTGFPDDLESPGPTIVTTGTLREVSSWFDITDVEEARR